MHNHRMRLIILLVEDQPDIRQKTTRFLLRAFPDAFVLHAATASQAIAVIASEAVDLVVSDFELEGVETGGDLLAWVRRQRPALEDRFVFLSGLDCSLLHRHALIKGAPPAEQRAYLTEVVASGTLSACPM